MSEYERLLAQRIIWEPPPRLMTRRRWRGKYRQIRCAWCYRRFWPWQLRVKGANYFPHPWMDCHLADFTIEFLRDNVS